MKSGYMQIQKIQNSQNEKHMEITIRSEDMLEEVKIKINLSDFTEALTSQFIPVKYEI